MIVEDGSDDAHQDKEHNSYVEEGNEEYAEGEEEEEQEEEEREGQDVPPKTEEEIAMGHFNSRQGHKQRIATLAISKHVGLRLDGAVKEKVPDVLQSHD